MQHDQILFKTNRPYIQFNNSIHFTINTHRKITLISDSCYSTKRKPINITFHTQNAVKPITKTPNTTHKITTFPRKTLTICPHPTPPQFSVLFAYRIANCGPRTHFRGSFPGFPGHNRKTQPAPGTGWGWASGRRATATCCERAHHFSLGFPGKGASLRTKGWV